MKILAFLLALTPSFVHVAVRKMMGAKIGRGSKIRFGTLLLSPEIEMGKGSSIGPLSYVSAAQFKIRNNSKIRPLSVVSASKVEIDDYVHISPLTIISGNHGANSSFKVGDHTRFFPFCWVDTGEGVELGKHVGIGGHTLIFTHGVWSDFLDGGPIARGPVKIEDHVWLPWRVFVMPGVTIGSNSIIGANSTVTSSVEANVVAAGSPAKTVKQNALKDLTESEKNERAIQILVEFSRHINHTGRACRMENEQLIFSNKIVLNDATNTQKGDILFKIDEPVDESLKDQLKAKGVSVISHADKRAYVAGQNDLCMEFIAYLRRYGIRLSI